VTACSWILTIFPFVTALYELILIDIQLSSTACLFVGGTICLLLGLGNAISTEVSRTECVYYIYAYDYPISMFTVIYIYVYGDPISMFTVILYLCLRWSYIYAYGDPISMFTVILYLRLRWSYIYVYGDPISMFTVILYLCLRWSYIYVYGDSVPWRNDTVAYTRTSCFFKANFKKIREKVPQIDFSVLKIKTGMVVWLNKFSEFYQGVSWTDIKCLSTWRLLYLSYKLLQGSSLWNKRSWSLDRFFSSSLSLSITR